MAQEITRNQQEIAHLLLADTMRATPKNQEFNSFIFELEKLLKTDPMQIYYWMTQPKVQERIKKKISSEEVATEPGALLIARYTIMLIENYLLVPSHTQAREQKRILDAGVIH